MKYTIPCCPECGDLAIGTVDLVPGVARFLIVHDGTFIDYDGETEMRWDSQYTIEEGGKTRLTCGDHDWYSPTEPAP